MEWLRSLNPFKNELGKASCVEINPCGLSIHRDSAGGSYAQSAVLLLPGSLVSCSFSCKCTALVHRRPDLSCRMLGQVHRVQEACFESAELLINTRPK